jgi:hypothetical protein
MDERRFARDVIAGATALQRLVESGARLIAYRTGLDSARLTPEAQLIFNVMMSIGQAERERNKLRRIYGKQKKARLGVYCAPTPFGYDRDEAGRLVANSDAERVRAIFHLRADGVGYSEIVRQVELPGRGTARQVIRNRVYLGEQRVPSERKGHPIVLSGEESRIPPLVTEQEWQAANAIQGRPPVRRGHGATALLKGLAICGLCGRPLGVNGYGPGRDKATYVCTRRGCGRVALAQHRLEPLVLAAVHAAIANDEPHVTATLANDDRYQRALDTLTHAQAALADYRDNIELQQLLGIRDFAEGLRARQDKIETARRALRDTARPAANQAPRQFDPTNLHGEYADYEAALARRIVAEIRLYPLGAEQRLTLRWHGAEEPVAVG